MQITFFPSRSDTPMTLSRRGSRLEINGQTILLEKYIAGENPFIIGQPVRIDGQWTLSLMLPHGATAGKETLFPKVALLDCDGPVELPPFEVIAEETMI